jgi:hypothetical protein
VPIGTDHRIGIKRTCRRIPIDACQTRRDQALHWLRRVDAGRPNASVLAQLARNGITAKQPEMVSQNKDIKTVGRDVNSSQLSG